MEPRENRWALSEEAYQELKEAHAAVVDEFLDPETKLPNVVGLGIGIRLVGGDPEWGNIGEPTGEPVLQVFVTRKLPREALAENDLIPRELAGKPTDVIEQGRLMPSSLTQRFRPPRGGCSVSDTRSTSGTIACGVWSTSLNVFSGVGETLLLSNNHVLADCNRNRVGEPILQPGVGDGGRLPADQIGQLFDFEPIDFFPPLPLSQHNNLIDAATADSVQSMFGELDRQIYWSGYVRGYTSVSPSLIGRQVKKTGRTSELTIGRITSIGVTVIVPYQKLGMGDARFRDVIYTTSMSLPGDSGSLLTTLDNVAVGLLFAGDQAANVSAHNPIEHVHSILKCAWQKLLCHSRTEVFRVVSYLLLAPTLIYSGLLFSEHVSHLSSL